MPSCPPRPARRPSGPGRARGPAGPRCWLAAALLAAAAPWAGAADIVTGNQRATAQQVAQAGVPLSALAPNAPAAHTVQRGDTLWAIASLFLSSPWRWPELWGMNLQDIKNPHLIYPGQVLVLVNEGGRVRLQLARADGSGGSALAPTNTVKLSPRIRSQLLDNGAIASIPMQLILPFLNEAMVLSQDALNLAPRIVATQEGRVMISRGETAYVRGDLQGLSNFTLFREGKALKDPLSGELLGFEATYVGTADQVRAASQQAQAGGKPALQIPATVVMTSARLEAGVGDRLAAVPPRDFSAFVPHAPGSAIDARVVSIYGEALTAGQNQIVALNRGARDGLERGHVMALWRAGALATDRTALPAQPLQLPDERSGLVFVFRVFDRVAYALILSATEPVRPGDRVSPP